MAQYRRIRRATDFQTDTCCLWHRIGRAQFGRGRAAGSQDSRAIGGKEWELIGVFLATLRRRSFSTGKEHFGSILRTRWSFCPQEPGRFNQRLFMLARYRKSLKRLTAN